MELLPAFVHVAEAFGLLGEAYEDVGEAVNETSSCGTSGSSQDVLYVAHGNANICKTLKAVAKTVKQETDSNGQLKLLNGNLTALTSAFQSIADGFNPVNRVVVKIAHNISKTNVLFIEFNCIWAYLKTVYVILLIFIKLLYLYLDIYTHFTFRFVILNYESSFALKKAYLYRTSNSIDSTC